MIKNNIFDTIAGLPVHPLIDHLVVVILPLSAISLILLVFIPSLRKNYFLITLFGLAVSLVGSFIAKESGEALGIRIGTPAEHAQWGEKVVIVAALLFVSSVAWYLLHKQKSGLTSLVGYVSALLAVAALVVTFLAGHSGATATWGKRLQSQNQTTTAAQSTNESTPGSTSSGAIELSMATVQTKNTPADCWAVVKNQVYNLSAYVTAHPGGVANITNLCGTDATAAFANQHGSQGKPNQTLSAFLVGTLGSTIDSIPTPDPIAVNNGGEEEEENEGDED